MPCAKVLPSMSVDVTLCGSVPRSQFMRRAESSHVDATVSKADVYRMAMIDGMGRKKFCSGYGLVSSEANASKISRDALKLLSVKQVSLNVRKEFRAVAYKEKKASGSASSFGLTVAAGNSNSKKRDLQQSRTSDNPGKIGTIYTCLKGQAASNDLRSTILKTIKKVSPLLASQNVSVDANLPPEQQQMPPRTPTGPTITRVVSSETMVPHADFVVPSWAVPAPGESRLEPLCDEAGCRSSVDLTHESVYYVGRSPSNHVALHHRTSSRRHALLFHHPCGACYLVDSQSAHGTFVNGNRVAPNVPIRIKRGSLLRFGGPGAPCFMLKSFLSSIDSMVRDLSGVAKAFGKTPACSQEVHMLEQQARANGVACVRGDGGMACIIDEKDAPAAALVLLNTRINACGGLRALTPSGCKLATSASEKFQAKSNWNKRSRDVDEAERPQKRVCTKPILSRTWGCSTLPAFHSGCASDRLLSRKPLLSVPRKKVVFSDEQPVSCFPASVTPEELSSDSECEEDDRIAVLEPVGMAGSM